MNENNILSEKICALRKECGFTQDQLAGRLGVTYQAVSKWENGLSCPDISLLPRLAEVFDVSIDRLFGRETTSCVSLAVAEAPPQPCSDSAEPVYIFGELPWDDDGNLHAVLFRGHHLADHRRLSAGELHAMEKVELCFTGDTENVYSDFSVSCSGSVGGDISAGGGIVCGDVGGDADAGLDIECRGDIGGSADAGTGINCGGSIGGDADAGGSINCGGSIGGDADAGGSISCGGHIGGDADAGGNISSGNIGGSADAGGSINANVIAGDADAGTFIKVGRANGRVSDPDACSMEDEADRLGRIIEDTACEAAKTAADIGREAEKAARDISERISRDINQRINKYFNDKFSK